MAARRLPATFAGLIQPVWDGATSAADTRAAAMRGGGDAARAVAAAVLQFAAAMRLLSEPRMAC